MEDDEAGVPPLSNLQGTQPRRDPALKAAATPAGRGVPVFPEALSPAAHLQSGNGSLPRLAA